MDTLTQLRELAEKISETREIRDAIKRQLSEHTAELDKLETEFLNIMEAAQLPRFDTEDRMFLRVEKSSVKVPKSLEEKAALFDYMKACGVLDEYLTVNSVSLNKWFREMKEAAEAEGELEFRVPGLEETTYAELSVRKR